MTHSPVYIIVIVRNNSVSAVFDNMQDLSFADQLGGKPGDYVNDVSFLSHLYTYVTPCQDTVSNVKFKS